MNNSKVQSIVVSICKSYLTGQAFSSNTLKSILETKPADIIRYAKAHKLETILYKVIATNPILLKSEVFKRLKYWNELIHEHNQQLKTEAGILKEIFKKEGIRIEDYKGSKFTTLFYEDLTFRKSIDVDFAIGSSDLDRVKPLMTRFDFREAKSQKYMSDDHKRKKYLDFPFVRDNKEGNKILVEFHIAPAHKALYLPYSFEMRFRQSDLEFDLLEQALFIIIHHGVVDTWGKMMHLIDLNQILKVLSKQEYDQLVQLSDQYGLRKFLDVGIMLLKETFGLSFEHSPKFRYKRISRYREDIVQSRLTKNWSKSRKKIRYFISMRSDFRSKILSWLSLFRFIMYKKLRI